MLHPSQIQIKLLAKIFFIFHFVGIILRGFVMYFSQNNQRSFHRMKLGLPVVITKDAKVFNGICSDLSSTGMLVEISASGLKADDLVHIQLDTDDVRFPPLDAEAKLIRVTEDENGKVSAAVEFLELK